jgi:hypothetical protein
MSRALQIWLTVTTENKKYQNVVIVKIIHPIVDSFTKTNQQTNFLRERAILKRVVIFSPQKVGKKGCIWEIVHFHSWKIAHDLSLVNKAGNRRHHHARLEAHILSKFRI